MTAFITWLGTYGSVIAFFVQIGFYIAVAVAAVWSTLLFRKYVNGRSVAVEAVDTQEAVATADAAESVDAPSVDDFVD